MAPITTNGTNGYQTNDPETPRMPSSRIRVAQSYLFQQQIEKCLAATGSSEARDYPGKLAGVRHIDEVRRAVRLPVRTYNIACVYYHKFRLGHPDTDYDFQDAAAAALFTACKIEDTLKKSRELLCTIYNLKTTTAEPLTPDNPLLEEHSKRLIGLERLMLESSGFDFRGKQVQSTLIKIARQCNIPQGPISATAVGVSLDLYRTFAPLKQTKPTMALASLELAILLHESDLQCLRGACDSVDDFCARWKSSRSEVMETLHDLLDYYTGYYVDYRTSRTGLQTRPLETFLALRIALNKEAAAKSLPRYTEYHASVQDTSMTSKTLAANPGSTESAKPSPTSPTQDLSSSRSVSMNRDGNGNGDGNGNNNAHGLRNGSGSGTLRFMLDAQRAKDERKTIEKYTTDEWEEYQEVIERPVTAAAQQPIPTAPRGSAGSARDGAGMQRGGDRSDKKDEEPGRDQDRDQDRNRDRDRARVERGGDRDRARNELRDQDRARDRVEWSRRERDDDGLRDGRRERKAAYGTGSAPPTGPAAGHDDWRNGSHRAGSGPGPGQGGSSGPGPGARDDRRVVQSHHRRERERERDYKPDRRYR